MCRLAASAQRAVQHSTLYGTSFPLPCPALLCPHSPVPVPAPVIIPATTTTTAPVVVTVTPATPGQLHLHGTAWQDTAAAARLSGTASVQCQSTANTGSPRLGCELHRLHEPYLLNPTS